jgi:hypothetical protein
MAAIASPITGSSHHHPRRAFANRLVRVPAAISAHNQDCSASLAVADEPSRVAMSRFAVARSGINTIAAAETPTPAQLVCGRELLARLVMLSMVR